MAGDFSTAAPIVASPAVFSANASAVTRAAVLKSAVFSANASAVTRAAVLKSAVFSANGAAHTSPGQRPGYAPSLHQALKGRPNRCLAAEGGAVYGQ
jgi:hypothetical protein